MYTFICRLFVFFIVQGTPRINPEDALAAVKLFKRKTPNNTPPLIVLFFFFGVVSPPPPWGYCRPFCLIRGWGRGCRGLGRRRRRRRLRYLCVIVVVVVVVVAVVVVGVRVMAV